MNENMRKKYADLIIDIGVNLLKDEELVISTPVFCTDLANEIAKSAYSRGAKKVSMLYFDEKFTHLKYQNENITEITNIPDYVVGSRDYIIDKKACYVCILADNPDLFSDIDPKIISAFNKENHKRNKKFYDSSTDNYIKWCLVAYSTADWAKKVFPELDAQKGVEKLWEKIFSCMRLDTPDPKKAWLEHFDTLKKRCEYLNSKKIKSLHYKNKLGTDFTVLLPKNYIFNGGQEKNTENILFTPNMPTEEVFSAPLKTGSYGKLYSSYPLVYNGNKIIGLKLEIENGKIIDFDAKQGKDILKGIINTDEGSHYLGEVALVGTTSLVNEQQTLFYETLFDENASCHFAIGQSYSNCVKNGENMTTEQLEKIGLNNSLVHVDFMVGTSDLKITAVCEDDSSFTIMEKGELLI